MSTAKKEQIKLGVGVSGGNYLGELSLQNLPEDLREQFSQDIIWAAAFSGRSDTQSYETERLGSNVRLAEIEYYPPRWYSPLLSWVHFYMPTDIVTTYTWIRHWDAFHPMVGNAIDMHSQLPLSRFSLKVKDPAARKVYEESIRRCGGMALLYDIAREYWLLGEAFVYLFWDENSGMWIDAQLIPPEDLDIIHKGLVLDANKEGHFIYRLKVSKPYMGPEVGQLDKQFLENLPPELSEFLQKGGTVDLDPFFLMTFFKKQAPYMTRGSSIVLRVMKDLLLEDKLREAQYAIAQRFVAPKEIWRIGDERFPANDEMINALKQVVKDAEQLPLFTLFTNHTVKLEYVTGVNTFTPLKEEFNWIEDRILTAMFTNKALTHGEGPTYANASVAMRVLMERYMFFRSLIEEVFLERFFLPIAVAHQFYEVKPSDIGSGPLLRRPFSEREPILPVFDWHHKVTLLDSGSLVNMISTLRDMGFPIKVICDIVDLDYDEVLAWKEREQGTVFDEIYQTWKEKAGEAVPPPVAPEPGAKVSFKLPVKVGERRISKDVVEPIIEEKEFSWPDKQHLLAKARMVKEKIEKGLKNQGFVLAHKVGTLTLDSEGRVKIEQEE